MADVENVSFYRKKHFQSLKLFSYKGINLHVGNLIKLLKIDEKHKYCCFINKNNKHSVCFVKVCKALFTPMRYKKAHECHLTVRSRPSHLEHS